MARSLVSCGCIALSVGLGLSVLGAGAAWFAIPGDSLGEKFDSLVESMQTVEFEVVDVVPLEGGGCDLQIEARPLHSWDITSLEVSDVFWSWSETAATEPNSATDSQSMLGELQTRPPLLAGREPARFTVRFPQQPPESADDQRVRMRIDVSAVKYGGTSKATYGYDETVRFAPAATDAPADEASEPR